MRFPFVSRERYEEQRMNLDRARGELADERDRNFRLFNWTMWRIGGGVAFDTSLLPEQYQPKAAAPVTEEKENAALHAVRAPGQARRDISKFEVEQEQALGRANSGHRPMSKEQVSLISELNKAADEGQKAAG